uniref:Chitin-binding type-2 domain-containing protein n=1 Tax=Anopheles dirus TaxID=7168 RepID=A0A1Y9H251_9DIPT
MMASRLRGWKIIAGLLVVVAAGSCGAVPAGTGRQTFADNALCPVPRCVTYAEINTLWALSDPAYFLQCRPVPTGGWSVQLMPCAPATLFSYRRQVCVDTEHWEGCDGTESGTTTLAPNAELCVEPVCVTYEDINTLWVHRQPGRFYQCRPHQNGTWVLQEMPCAPGTLFSFRQQVCVLEALWDELPDTTCP